MTNLDSNNPPDFGWSYPPTDIIDFQYGGHVFYNGISKRAAAVFTTFLDRLCALPGFKLHSGSGSNDGDWGYQDRGVIGGSGLSFHAYGLAIDVNAPWNPQGVSGYTGEPYGLPDETDGIALGLGLLWGGNVRFGSNPDRMHIECHRSPGELITWGGSRGPLTFPLGQGHWFGMRSTGPGAVDGFGDQAGYRPEIRHIQARVGTIQDGLYGPQTTRSVVAYQQRHHVASDGLVGPVTWALMV